MNNAYAQSKRTITLSAELIADARAKSTASLLVPSLVALMSTENCTIICERRHADPVRFTDGEELQAWIRDTDEIVCEHLRLNVRDTFTAQKEAERSQVEQMVKIAVDTYQAKHKVTLAPTVAMRMAESGMWYCWDNQIHQLPNNEDNRQKIVDHLDRNFHPATVGRE